MGRAAEVTVSARQGAILEKWTRNKAGTPYRLVERARLILMSAEGVSNTEQGRGLNVDRQRARRWRTRWAENEERLAAAEQEGVSEKELTQLLSSLLSDDERPGTPPTFTAEQLTQIIGVACELPEESGRPVTHWTPRKHWCASSRNDVALTTPSGPRARKVSLRRWRLARPSSKLRTTAFALSTRLGMPRGSIRSRSGSAFSLDVP